MTYNFQGQSYQTERRMADAIAEEWITAGGSNNDRAVATELGRASNEILADDAIEGWCLTVDRAELVEAFDRYRAAFSGPAR